MTVARTSFVPSCPDPIALHEWYPITARDEIKPGVVHHTMLLGDRIAYAWRDGAATVWAQDDPVQQPLRTCERYGYVWASLGQPDHDLFDIVEYHEPDRRILNGGSIMVATSAPRAVENFLDMGHFPYVHTGLLGIEPRTEVVEYDVDVTDAQVLATKCLFYQPVASVSAKGGQLTEYIYRVPHPYCVMLYKSVQADPSRMDVIALFVQPLTEESVRAHNFLCMVDEESSQSTLRHFQQMIFGQDKTILENQFPKRLPLDPRAETPIRADKSSIGYRRWLTQKGVSYAVIRAAS